MPRPTGRVGRSAFAVACLGLALCRAEAVFASTFRVSPVQITLSASTPSALLTLSNDSREEMRFQVSAFAWDQDANGQMRLTPTQDVVFFPMMIALGPGQERKLRVGSATPVLADEKTYRLFIEELPPSGLGSTRSNDPQVRVLTRMGIPIFLEPAQPKVQADIEVREVSGVRIRFAVRNRGNTRFLLERVHVIGTGPAGEGVLDRNADGWYVLAGGERVFEQTISPDECTRLKSVAIEARTDRGDLSARRDVPALDCEPPAANRASLGPR